MAFKDAFGTSLGTSLGGSIIGAVLPSSTTTSGSASGTSTTTSTQQKVLSQQAIDKLVYDVLSADTGLASLATGENLSGGYAASTKALLAQDFVTKLVGELANVTAPTTQTQTTEQQSQSSSKTKKKVSIICTFLYRQGLLSPSLYTNRKALRHFKNMNPTTVRGYLFWATPLVQWLPRHMGVAILLAPLFASRYRQITTGRITIGGMLTIYIGQPICFAIGTILNALDSIKKGMQYGHRA